MTTKSDATSNGKSNGKSNGNGCPAEASRYRLKYFRV
jgi:hypothetical protein